MAVLSASCLLAHSRLCPKLVRLFRQLKLRLVAGLGNNSGRFAPLGYPMGVHRRFLVLDRRSIELSIKKMAQAHKGPPIAKVRMSQAGHISMT